MIPDLEPMLHPCHEDLHQPAGLQPYDPQQPDNIDIEIPTDADAEEELFQLAADQPLPHHAPTAIFPSPVPHLPAPEVGHIPLPSNLNTSTPQVDPPTKARRTGSQQPMPLARSLRLESLRLESLRDLDHR